VEVQDLMNYMNQIVLELLTKPKLPLSLGVLNNNVTCVHLVRCLDL